MGIWFANELEEETVEIIVVQPLSNLETRKQKIGWRNDRGRQLRVRLPA
jgi:hypothetical protein